jgi:hypothetical protein
MKTLIPFVLLTALLAIPLHANAEEKPAPMKSVEEISKDIWEDTKAAGRAIRDSKAGKATKEAGKEIGKDTAEVSKDVWKKVSKASVAAAKDVRDATVQFWNAKIVGKERERDRLEKENAELREESK